MITNDGTAPCSEWNQSIGLQVTGTSQGLTAAATLNDPGAWGIGGSGAGRGVYGTSPSGFGIYGESTSGKGVYGKSTSSYGVQAYSSTNTGLYAESGASGQNGVTGKSNSWGASGVYGENFANGMGLAGRSNSNGRAIFADNTCNGSGCSGYAGYFNGRTYTTGSQAAGGTKTFKIDHPLDPENRYLLHAAVEGPEVLNFYSGNAVLDGRGQATVKLPDYFGALNGGEIRYQLTTIGGYAQVFVAEEVDRSNRFVIAGGKPGMKVSWQVTGVRNDAYLRANPFVAEQAKEGDERGRYVHPEAWGKPASKAEARSFSK